MKRGLLFLFATFLLAVGRAAAQDAPIQDEMRFIQELRNQGKSDLALEYLQRLMKNPSPELAKELPLEIAKTRLGAAGDEPDSGKRLNLYAQARDEFQKWLLANVGHPRASEVRLDVAQVAVLQGRTQLSQAFMNADFAEVTTPEAGKARAMLIDAGAQVQAAAKGLDEQLAKLGDPKTPADKDLKKKLENDRLQADLNIALNLFDVAMSYPRNARSTDEAKERGKKVDEARTAFEKVSAKDDLNPVCWVAKAWAGRCLHENGEGNKARLKYTEILNGDKRITAEAQRLARYFRLLVIREKPEGTENDAYIVDRAKEWINDFPGYLKTPEGYGLRYLLAQEYWTLINSPGGADKAATYLTEARRVLRQVEQSENDFTDRARRLKIQVIARQQGGFKEPVDKLKNFEDCYVRAQFELMEMSKEEKETKDPKELEAKKKAHQDLMTTALERGLKLADESKTGHEESLELGNAKAMLAFQYMNGKRFREAIALAEPFARNDPRSAQAAAAAVYALQCYAENISNQEAAGKTPDELQAERKKLFEFAAFMEKTWPKETPGDMARHQLALLYINDKDPDPVKHVNNIQQAIQAMQRITPGYANYTVTQYQLAQFAFGADKEKIPPLAGDMDDGYRKRALAALENIPPLAAGADPTTNKVYFLAKIRLAQEYFQLKKFDEMEALTTTLQPRLAGLPLDADKGADDKLHTDFEDSIKGFRLYSRWAKADAEVKAADKAAPAEKPVHYITVMTLLDPIVDEILAKQHPELKNNLPLARGVLDNDLRASIQLNKLERTPIILNGYKELATGDAADAGAAEVLKQLVVFIPPQLEELKHRKDGAADLKKAQDVFGKILEDTIKPLTGDKLTPKLVYFTSQIYSSMDKHKEAADLLDKVPEPAKDAPKTDVDLYQTIRVLLVKERRMNSETDEARKIMDGIMGDPKTPGWGRKKIDALMENVEVLAAEGNNKSAAEFANALIQKLLPKIDADNKIKDLYLQCYYLMVENAYRQAMKLKGKPQAAGVKQAANLAVDLAKKHSGFVNDTMRGRFRDLMDGEPDLKGAFLDAYLSTVETGAKEAGALKDEAQQKKADGDVAALIVDLEKLWPDYGGDAAKDRATGLLGKDAKLKEQYDALKGAAAP